MRILSARIHRANRDRVSGRVTALVTLTALCGSGPIRAFIPVTVPARSAGAAPLRERLLGIAKLGFAAHAVRMNAAKAA